MRRLLRGVNVRNADDSAASGGSVISRGIPVNLPQLLDAREQESVSEEFDGRDSLHAERTLTEAAGIINLRL